MILPRFPVKGGVTIVVKVSDGIDENGAANIIATYSGSCVFDEKSRTRYSADGTAISLTGLAIIMNDIAPNVEKLSGTASINSGSEMTIFAGKRVRDLSGRVHHVELELV